MRKGSAGSCRGINRFIDYTLCGFARVAETTFVELAIRALKDGGVAHIPSGHYPANAAWFACAVIARCKGALRSEHPQVWGEHRLTVVGEGAYAPACASKAAAHTTTPSWCAPSESP